MSVCHRGGASPVLTALQCGADSRQCRSQTFAARSNTSARFARKASSRKRHGLSHLSRSVTTRHGGFRAASQEQEASAGPLDCKGQGFRLHDHFVSFGGCCEAPERTGSGAEGATLAVCLKGCVAAGAVIPTRRRQEPRRSLRRRNSLRKKDLKKTLKAPIECMQQLPHCHQSTKVHVRKDPAGCFTRARTNKAQQARPRDGRFRDQRGRLGELAPECSGEVFAHQVASVFAKVPPTLGT